MTFDLQKQFGTDKTREIEGVWFDVGGGARVKVARANNPEYRRVLTRLLRPHRAAIRAETIPPETLDPLVTHAMAEALLLDWEGVSVAGKPVKYSREAAKKLLGDFPDFRDLIAEMAESREAYLAAEVEEGKATSGK